jgi:hypothetical protein
MGERALRFVLVDCVLNDLHDLFRSLGCQHRPHCEDALNEVRLGGPKKRQIFHSHVGDHVAENVSISHLPGAKMRRKMRIKTV